MEKININIGNDIAHYFSTNSEGEDAHFYPGNGLPNGVYKPFLNLLAEKYNLTSLAFRATWENAPIQNNQVDWHTYADDLICFLDSKYDKPIIGIGHSQGAVATIIAAAKRPDLFKSLYLIEPVSVSKFEEICISLVPYFFKKKTEPFKSTLKKQAVWKSPDEYFEFLKNNKGFKRINEENLKLFAKESLTFKAESHYELAFPVDWEVANYGLPICLDKYLQKLTVPHKIILGKPSFFLSEKTRVKLKEIVRGKIAINSHYGHLIPLEAPQFCAEEIFKS